MTVPTEAAEAVRSSIVAHLEEHGGDYDLRYSASIRKLAAGLVADIMPCLAEAWERGGRDAIDRENTYGAEEKAKYANPYRTTP